MLAEAQRQVHDTQMSVSKRFGRFKDEKEQPVRAPQVTEDHTLRQLKEAWAKVRFYDELLDLEGREYRSCLNAVRGLKYTSADVENFSIALAEFQDAEDFKEKAGYFLSALVNNCPDSDFVIHTRHMGGRIDHLGHYNTKNITIDGDAGENLAYRMEGGRITVEGNTGNDTGQEMKTGEIVINGDSGHSLGASMKGGKITVEGNAGVYTGIGMKNGEIAVNGNTSYYLANGMEGGKITVRGNAGHWIGDCMEGGEIRIEGRIERHNGLTDNFRGGKIYHKGNLVLLREA